jgi:hypothetical protein
MKRIEYRVTYNEHGSQYLIVHARGINSGFRKAVALALRDLPSGWEIVRVEFWMVTS